MTISRRRFLAFTTILAARPIAFGSGNMPSVPANLDHILLGSSDLDRGIDWMEERSGVRAMFGGVHPGRGTRNALLALGPRRYLEIIAPDPAQGEKGLSHDGLSFVNKLHNLETPRLVGWAVHTDDLVALAKRVAAAGLDIEPPRDGSRTRPDQKILRWKSFSLKQDRGGLLPFFIEWSHDSIHPAEDAPKGNTINQFAVESWMPEIIDQTARKLGLDLISRSGKKPGLHAGLTGPKGAFELF
jgi:hypothetical protein